MVDGVVGQQHEWLAEMPIRYDGGDAESHSIELNVLGESMQGMARLLSVAGNFVVTGEYVKQYQAMDVRVLVKEPEANCYTITALLATTLQHPLFVSSAGAAVGAIVTWVFAKVSGNKDEMKALKDTLDKVLDIQSSNQEKLHATLDKMADALKPAVRQAVAPVGRSVGSMTIAGHYVVDEAMASAIRDQGEVEVGLERTWELLITELDTETKTGKVRLSGDDGKRIKVRITDPLADTTPSPYAIALANATTLSVRGKPTLRDGDIDTIFISDLIS